MCGNLWYTLYIHIYIYMLLKVKFLATRTRNLLYTDVATSTTSLLQGCVCCDNWCCLPVDFLLPEFFGYGKKLQLHLFVARI